MLIFGLSPRVNPTEKGTAVLRLEYSGKSMLWNCVGFLMDNELKGFLHVPILAITLAGIGFGTNFLFPLGPWLITMAFLSLSALHCWPPEKIPKEPGFGDGVYNDD